MLGQRFLSAILLLAAGVSAVPSPFYPVLPRSTSSRRCATPDPSQDIINQMALLESLNEPAMNETIDINIYVHVVEPKNVTTISTKMVVDQVGKLNVDYAFLNMKFNLVETTRTVNDRWGVGRDAFGMKRALRKGRYSDLNLYAVGTLSGGLLGYATFPENVSEGSNKFYEDGCVVAGGTLPGGDIDSFNLGATATHEVGHWVHLWHTFQGQSCTGSGDFVDDTPIQSTPTTGCPTTQDSCPNSPGVDAVQNFMDYSDDDCMTEFSLGQKRRALIAWETFRRGK